MTFDERLDQIVGPVADLLNAIVFFAVPIGGAQVPLIVVWLMGAAVFITVWLRFQPITGMRHSIDVIRGRFQRKTDPGEVSSFQALATELSGTVGLGNIAGVAIAIALGGPGATVWLFVFGFFGMSVKMAEATLGVKYRTVRPDGTTKGGPMYYLRDGLAALGRPRTGSVLAVLYAVFTVVGVFGAGNLFQSNQVAAAIATTAGEGSVLDQNRWILGVGLAVLVGAVILGGITSIGRWTGKITPAMGLLYVVSCLVVIAVNITALPDAVVTIFQGAFTGQGVAGGALGVAVIGIQRALFSNAAGIGSAGMAHSAAKTDEPATEGFAAMWEPLVDTMIICMMSALAIVMSGAWQQGAGDGSTMAGVELTAAAFETVAPWFSIVLIVAVVLFGYSTLLSYYYYGELAAMYLFGDKPAVRRIFRSVWIVFVVIGAAVALDSVIAFSDAMLFLMSVPSLLGIFFLARVLRREILAHKLRVDTGVLRAVPEDLSVGMGDHEPTTEQIEAEERRVSTAALELRELQDRLDADPDYPSDAETRRRERALRRKLGRTV